MKYLIRSVKYFLHLCVLALVLIAILFAVGMTSGTPEQLIYITLHTWRGWVFIGAILALSAIYPRIGFMTARLKGDLQTHRRQITEALCAEGFVPVVDQQDVMIFRASRLVRRLAVRFDDKIVVRQQQDGVSIEGLRKVIAQVEPRIDRHIRNENE